MKRRDVIAHMFDEALERVFGAEAAISVYHPKGDFDPHIDVYAIGPSPERAVWTLVTAGLSWWMAAARKSGRSMRRPVELFCVLPPELDIAAVTNAASALAGISEFPVRHGTSF